MKVNNRVVSDKFENEFVVVNLQNGFYYSFRNSAAGIWQLIQDREASRATVLTAFGLLPAEAEAQIFAFIDMLIRDELVTEAGDDDRAVAVDRLEYTHPEFSRFEDMADLIMIDPIHEADTTKGWPQKPE